MGSRLSQERIDPALWQRSDMRSALAARDIGAVFRLLQRSGVSQRRIAALTGQSQSEISEILGGRQVVSYELLARIAEGLGVPRGHLGLAYDEATALLVEPRQSGGGQPSGVEEGEAGPPLARLTELAVGTVEVDPLVWARPVTISWDAPPVRVGLGDVARLQTATYQLRALDYAQGGGASRDAALAQVAWAQHLLRATVDGGVERALHAAVGDAHLLAGWSAFDIGRIGPARRHFTRALEHARFVDEPSLVAKALYCLARVSIHHGWGGQAVRVLQLAQVAAQESGLGRGSAMIHANLAWAYAQVGEVSQTLAEISRARDEYGRGESEPAPLWLRFFDSAELQALRGAALAYLPELTPQQRHEAIERFSLSSALRELPMTRSRAFELTMLAWMLVDNGDLDQAVQVGHQALTLAEQLRSQRVIDRMAPLQSSIQRVLGGRGGGGLGELRELDARIAALSQPRGGSASTAA